MLSFHSKCLDELLGLLLTADPQTRLRVRGNLGLLDEFGPGMVALFDLGGDYSLHELRLDTDPAFGLVCVVQGDNTLALAAYFDHGNDRHDSLIHANERHSR